MALGYVSKAHGIRGEVAFVPTTDSPDLAQGQIYLMPRGGGPVLPFTVTARRRHHGLWLLSLEGVCDRNAAETLRSHTLFIDKDRLPPLAEDEVFLSDLPGLTVFVVENGKESELGVITAAEAPAGQVLWTIRTPAGKEVLFPAVEEFILCLDPQSGAARIAPPPGLLELYL